MEKRELAYAKQAVLAVTDWDVFQSVIRSCKKMVNCSAPPSTVALDNKR